jgi:Ca-activated chloride channel family protein
MRALAAALLFAVATTTLAQTGNPPQADVVKDAPEDAVRKLSRRERKARIAKLDAKYQDFVADVEPILAGTEIDTFLLLETDSQRDSFVDDFWRRREAMHGTTNQSFKETYLGRLEIARQQFRKPGSDRARMFLIHGPPVDVVRTECQRLLQPIEIWKYPYVHGLGQNVRLLFYRPRGNGDYRLWNPIGGGMALSDLMVQDSSQFGADQPSRRGGTPESASPYNYINKIQMECQEGDEILRAITEMIQFRVDLLTLFQPPSMESEEMQKMLRSVVIANPKAPKLTAELSVRYPAKDGSRTDAQVTLLVPRAEVTPAEVGGAEVYTIDVTGEVLKEGKLWEKYRYRFDFPGEFDGEKLPIVIDRLLRPAEYTSRIKVIDANTGAEAVVEHQLDVPEIFTPVEGEEEARVPPASLPAPVPAEGRLEAGGTPVPPSLRIIPPPEEIVSGVNTIETVTTGEGIKAVEFWMDGKKIAVRRSSPFALDLDFGDIPQTRRIRAVALDANNMPVAGDEVQVNIGTDPFRVRIASPRIAPHLSGPTRVEMDVSVPEGDELESLELFWNEQRMATLYDPPFVQVVEIPPTSGVGYLRAVAKLKDEHAAPVEDVVVINTPAYMEELNVHLVELPTTVLVNGKPASHLTEKAFKVLDDGKPVAISKFEYVKNLPLSIGLAIDTSGSMQRRMDEAQKAGAQFFKRVMKKGDRAFLVAFDEEPQLVQKWSPRTGDMHAGLAKLRAEDTTALYDAVIFALYNFQGIRGQKALVLISDGKDTASKYTFDQAVEYARRAAIPIYAIGIGIKSNDMDVRYKLSRLASETGGSVFYIELARDLERVYDDIQNELRSQYILGFYPSPEVKAGGKWREISVQTSEGKVKSVKGYYP